MISGFSANLAYADNDQSLINNLKQGKTVAKDYWFASDQQANRYGIEVNKRVARLAPSPTSLFDQVCILIDRALEQAMLDKHYLSGERVRVYLTGLGPRIDVLDYLAFYDHNDIEDVKINPSIKNLHLAEMSQDKLAHFIASRYRLKYSPPNLHCTSNSSLSAVHLATQAIASGDIDLIVIVNCSMILTQDIVFLAEQSMLDGEKVQPFGQESRGVLVAEGYSVLVLESAAFREARGMEPGIKLISSYRQVSSVRGNNAAQLPSQIAKIINQVSTQANISLDDLCAIIPHANGSAVTDKAEVQVITSLLSGHSIPVLAYKGQIGYTTTGSGIIDLIIGHHSLCTGELISAKSNSPIREDMVDHLLIDKGVVKHDKNHLLKVGLGVDGSIIAVVMSTPATNRSTE